VIRPKVGLTTYNLAPSSHLPIQSVEPVW
jgi:hypothetical protein